MAKKYYSHKAQIIKNEQEAEQQATGSKKQRVTILPRNRSQEDYVMELSDPRKRIIVAVGPAGCGKTLFAVLHAIKEYKTGDIKKIIITRPTVPVEGEEIGFLPGTLNQKMEPWTKPIFDIFEEYFSVATIADMVKNNIIEVAPFAFLRGRNLKHAIVIADESQNTTPEQMKMLLTRISEGSRVFVTGDLRQTDIKKRNGLEDFIEKVNPASKTMGICRFTTNDVERDPIVAEVLRLYGED